VWPCVDEEQIDPGPEWRSFDDRRADVSRVGTPNTELQHDRGIGGTRIGYEDTDANGHIISSSKRQKLHRLRKWDRQAETNSTKERNIRQGLGEILRMTSALDLKEDVKETAAVIFRRASDDGLLTGHSIEGMASGAIYAAIRSIGLPIRLPEVVDVSQVSRMRVKKAYSLLNRELGLAIEPQQPENYIPQILSELNDPDAEQSNPRVSLSDEEALEQRARELLKAGREASLFSGPLPIGIAAGAIYAAELSLQNLGSRQLAQKKLQKTALADICDVSAVTIRKRYTELLEAYESA
jgi:transcription initiation factor TFIIB